MQHLDEGTIHAWLDGALPAEEAAAAERHARECAECAALVADARGMIAGAARIVSALDDVPGGVIPKQSIPTAQRSLWRTLRLTPFRAALAASLLVAAGSLAVIRNAPSPKREAESQNVASSSAATSPIAVAPAPKPFNAVPSTRVENKTVSDKRLRVHDEAPPSAPIAAAPAPREETKRAPLAEVAKATGAMDSIAASPRGVAGGAAPAPSAAVSEPRAKVMMDTARSRNEPIAAAAAQVSANAIARGVSRDAAMRKPAGLRALPFSFLFASADNRPLTTPGCYQLTRDSTTTTLPLPERFALDNERNPALSGNVVRALTQDGRRDSVLTGVTWQFAPGTQNLVLVRREAPLRSSLRQQTMSSPRPLASFNSDKPLRLSRIDCR